MNQLLKATLESTNRDLCSLMDNGPTRIPVNIMTDYYGSLITAATIKKLAVGVLFHQELQARGYKSLLVLDNSRFGAFATQQNTHVMDWNDPLHLQFGFCETRILMARKGCDWSDGDFYCIECGDPYATIIADKGKGFAFCSRHVTPASWDVEADYEKWPNAWRLHQARVHFTLREQGLADT